MLKKRSKCLLVANIFSTIYGVFILYFVFTLLGDDIDGGIAALLIFPHMLITLLGIIFGWVSITLRTTWAALTSAILYSVAAVLFIVYAVFLIIPIVLGFMGYANQKKINNMNL